MAKKHDSSPSKYSILVPLSLDKRIESLAEAKGMTVSAMVRQLMEEGVDLHAPQPGGRMVLCLHLDDSLADAVNMVSRQLHTSPEAVVKEIVLRHLPEVAREASEVAEALNNLLQGRKKTT